MTVARTECVLPQRAIEEGASRQAIETCAYGGDFGGISIQFPGLLRILVHAECGTRDHATGQGMLVGHWRAGLAQRQVLMRLRTCDAIRKSHKAFPKSAADVSAGLREVWQEAQ